MALCESFRFELMTNIDHLMMVLSLLRLSGNMRLVQFVLGLPRPGFEPGSPTRKAGILSIPMV
jgi:hypothetical protein